MIESEVKRMTIDEAIHHLYTYSSTLGSGQTTQAQHEESKSVAIDVMCKYQKITEIVKSWEIDTWTDGLSYECMGQISRVLESEDKE